MIGDRLSALDASFLHIEDSSAHMHVASVMLFEGPPPPYDELLEGIERPPRPRAALPPAARLRAARPGAPALGRRPAPQPPLPRPRDRAALSGVGGAADGPRRPGVLAAARPRQAALGDLARRGPRGRPLRAAREDPPCAGGRRLGHRHRLGALRHLARARRTDRRRRALAAASAPVERPAARRGAARARHRAGRGRAQRARRVPRPAPRARRPEERRRGRGRDGLGRAQPRPRVAVQRDDRPAPPLHLGPRRAARHQGDQGLARRDRQRRGARHRRRRARPAPAPPRARDRRARAEGDDPGERARRGRARRSSATRWRR